MCLKWRKTMATNVDFVPQREVVGGLGASEIGSFWLWLKHMLLYLDISHEWSFFSGKICVSSYQSHIQSEC